MFQFTLLYPEAIKIAKKLAHSVSKDENRPALNGFLMHKSEEKHYAASTDGHMLTRIEIKPQYGEKVDDTAIMRIPVAKEEFPDIIFPALAVKQIEQIKLTSGIRDRMPVTFFIDVAQLTYRIECYDQTFVGKLIDGAYPDYTRVIPAGWHEFPNEYGGFGFSPVYLAAIMKAASFNPRECKATVNPVRMFFSDGNPAVLQETQDPGIIYVIMPIRTSLPEHRRPVAEAEQDHPAEAEQASEPAASLIQYRGYHAGPKDTGGMTSLYPTEEEAIQAAQRCAYKDERVWANPEYVGPMDAVLVAIETLQYTDWRGLQRKAIRPGEEFRVGDVLAADHHVSRAGIALWLLSGRARSLDVARAQASVANGETGEEGSMK